MTLTELRPKVVHELTNHCLSREQTAEIIARAAKAMSFADASKVEQREFWKSLRADLEVAQLVIVLEGGRESAYLDAAITAIILHEVELW
jgi:hypothetical protein